MKLTGHCHCGNIRFEFETGYTPATLQLRACQCSFCRAHGAINASDPRGSLRFAFDDARSVQRYRFGLGVTDMLICTRCGCYAAAVTSVEGRWYGTINTNLLDCRTSLTQAPAPMDYAAETAVGRLARRVERWTPVIGDLAMLKA